MSDGAVQRDVIKAFALLTFCTFSGGVMPYIAKLAFNDGTRPEALMVIRSVVALAIFGTFLLVRGGSFRMPVGLVALAGLAAVANALFNFTYMNSNLHIDIGIATLVLFSHPLVAIYYHMSSFAS